MYPSEQIEELKKYCSKLSMLSEGNVTFYFMQELCLPVGCTPRVCDALLCPVEREGYPSRLYLSTQVSSDYSRNWNVSNARIGERNWFAFSWKVTLSNPTITQILLEHLKGFTKEK